jgi:hypothetical protein
MLVVQLSGCASASALPTTVPNFSNMPIFGQRTGSIQWKEPEFLDSDQRFLWHPTWSVAIFVSVVVGIGPAQEASNPAVPQTNLSGTTYSVQIEPITADDGPLPAEFAMAIYENLVGQVTKTGKFGQVFRSGDKRAAEAQNLLTLTMTLRRFQHGSSTKRAVTTVAGATKIAVDAKLVTRNSQVVFERSVEGKVRLFGENLKATEDLTKNIAKAIHKSSLEAR